MKTCRKCSIKPPNGCPRACAFEKLLATCRVQRERATKAEKEVITARRARDYLLDRFKQVDKEMHELEDRARKAEDLVEKYKEALNEARCWQS
jgi:hypothetical protein